MDWFAISGWFMTAIGLGVAVFQTYRVKRLTTRNKEQLEMFIQDANYVSFEHEIIDEIANKLPNPMIVRFLVASHQRGCDLYRGLVDFYLSSQRRFTYEDLNRVCQTPMISYRWQEEFWKGRITLRPENRKAKLPEAPYLTAVKTPRFQALRDRDALTDPTTLLAASDDQQART